MLDFHEDAIMLSGETGTKLKSEIIGNYYHTWWEITSGGPNNHFKFWTTIIEMDAATGQAYIEDTKETIYGSSGHALLLKATNTNTKNLNLVLVEKNSKCFEHLKNVIKNNWHDLTYCHYPIDSEDNDVFLVKDPQLVPEILDKYLLGNSLFFFDPLLYTPWKEIESIALRRISKYYKTGTEFIVFLFSSDWFSGRGELIPLPSSNDEKIWSEEETKTISKVDELFGNFTWRPYLLKSVPITEKIETLVDLYKNRLRKWFRYVKPLPFVPKTNQLYHLFICSNYEGGINITSTFYTKFSGNPRHSPNNNKAYSKFISLHPEKIQSTRTKRSDEWKILWDIIKNHEDGIADEECNNLVKIQPNPDLLVASINWLANKGYIKEIEHFTNVWEEKPPLFQLDWEMIKEKFDVLPPKKLIPLSNENKKEQASDPTTLKKFFN